MHSSRVSAILYDEAHARDEAPVELLQPVGPQALHLAQRCRRFIEQRGIQLSIGQTAALRIELSPGNFAESVT